MSALGMPHTIRSWLGNRRTSGTKPHSPKGNTMNFKRSLIVPTLALSAIAAGLTVGALSPSVTPAPSASPSVTASLYTCNEGDPCWDAAECRESTDDACSADLYAQDAWDSWDKYEWAKDLKVDPSRPYRVDFMAATDTYPENLDSYDLVKVGTNGMHYVFRASYLD